VKAVTSVGWQITLCDPIDKWRPVVLRWISRRTIRSFTLFLYIVYGFDLETYSKVIENGAIGPNTYDFLLVFYTNFGCISYCFCATVEFMPKWPCWATVTSRCHEGQSDHSKMRLAHNLPLVKISCKPVHSFLCEGAHRQTDIMTGKPTWSLRIDGT